ncbi:hypothetical protein LKMONMHP_3043 [Methylobacterium organophilum]|uniref:Uncharacterized protein n=1 Tax=Methylobacterium organophilum TaxID=410 RepID=A0ABQ4TCS1_METOR|nr:hypothetical protein LKMONMHP_3043 [Methylobacterium organophilum]
MRASPRVRGEGGSRLDTLRFILAIPTFTSSPREERGPCARYRTAVATPAPAAMGDVTVEKTERTFWSSTRGALET